MLNENLQTQLIETIKQQVNPDFIILFGSFAKGTTHDESDIDLAYFSKQQLSSYERFTLANDLAILAGCEGFKLLQEAGLIDAALAKTLMNMVGFRNIAVHT